MHIFLEITSKGIIIGKIAFQKKCMHWKKFALKCLHFFLRCLFFNLQTAVDRWRTEFMTGKMRKHRHTKTDLMFPKVLVYTLAHTRLFFYN